MVAGVPTEGEEIVDGNAALAQAPHEGELVAQAQVEESVPPHFVETHHLRIQMAPENQIVLHESGAERHAVQECLARHNP